MGMGEGAGLLRAGTVNLLFQRTMASAETFRNHSTQLEMVQHFTAYLKVA